jgi:penicillin-binding protein 1A
VNSLFTEEPTDERVKVNRRDVWRGRMHALWVRGTLQGPAYPSRRIAARRMYFILLGLAAFFGVLAGFAVIYSIDLPQMEELARYRPDTTTELLDVNGHEIGSFALERRVVIPYTDIPQNLQDAIISVEDKSFEHNSGVNLARAVEAAYTDIHSHSRAQGSSTLTMQLARNLFLSSQKTYSRKLQEIFLTLQIERRFTKQQIMTLYVNQIYLGHGRYGFEAGSEFYFSKPLRDVTLAEAALLAALPKGPELYSPLRDPDRALRRRNLVLSEMLQDGKINAAQAYAAKAEPLGLKIEVAPHSEAPYFVEEVRRQLEKEYGVEEVHGAGLRVYTTLDLDLQRAANKSVLDGLARYERRHGWKGNLQNVIAAGLDEQTYKHPDWTGPVEPGQYIHGMVTEVSAHDATVKVGPQQVRLTPADWVWTEKRGANSFLKPGDLVYVQITDMPPSGLGSATLQEDTGAQGSLMAMDNANGEVVAMVGGRDFALSQFNRATQAQRQVGSSFKPYVYTAAVEEGVKPLDIVVDAPTSFPTPGGYYTPHNYEANFAGPMTVEAAFYESRNIPALKLAARVGIQKVIAVAHKFGITSNLPPYLPIAIGAADITLEEQVGAYAVFPNDGIRIAPHYIRKVTQADGVPLDSTNADVSEVISVPVARTMMILLQSVIQRGTGSAAGVLHHPLGGKTGTTNDFTDAWFVGFSPSITCGTWVGYDNRQTLGKGEQGAKVALPTWIQFMKVAIAGKDDEAFPTGNAPKKKLDVDQNAPAPEQKAPDADTDSGTDTDDSAKPAAPVTAPPTLPDSGIPQAPAVTPATPIPTAPLPLNPSRVAPAPIVRQTPPAAAPPQ